MKIIYVKHLSKHVLNLLLLWFHFTMSIHGQIKNSSTQNKHCIQHHICVYIYIYYIFAFQLMQFFNSYTATENIPGLVKSIKSNGTQMFIINAHWLHLNVIKLSSWSLTWSPNAQWWKTIQNRGIHGLISLQIKMEMHVFRNNIWQSIKELGLSWGLCVCNIYQHWLSEPGRVICHSQAISISEVGFGKSLQRLL